MATLITDVMTDVVKIISLNPTDFHSVVGVVEDGVDADQLLQGGDGHAHPQDRLQSRRDRGGRGSWPDPPARSSHGFERSCPRCRGLRRPARTQAASSSRPALMRNCGDSGMISASTP